MIAANYSFPVFSLRFVPVWRRNFMVWKKLAVASVLGNIADPLITLIAFGYGLGSLLKEINGIPYIYYLASGSICMSIMMASSFESLYSAFSRMHVQRTWDALLNAPIDLDDVVLAEMLWAATKSLFTGVAILGVMFILGIGLHPHTLLVLPILFVIGMTFASLGRQCLGSRIRFFRLLFHIDFDADGFFVRCLLSDYPVAELAAGGIPST